MRLFVQKRQSLCGSSETSNAGQHRVACHRAAFVARWTPPGITWHPMDDAEETASDVVAPWIVSHRPFDSVEATVYAFSTEDKACRHAARLIRDELRALLEFVQDLDQTLRHGKYRAALQLYHEIADNLDTIEVSQVELDQFHSDEPLDHPAS